MNTEPVLLIAAIVAVVLIIVLISMISGFGTVVTNVPHRPTTPSVRPSGQRAIDRVFDPIPVTPPPHPAALFTPDERMMHRAHTAEYNQLLDKIIDAKRMINAEDAYRGIRLRMDEIITGIPANVIAIRWDRQRDRIIFLNSESKRLTPPSCDAIMTCFYGNPDLRQVYMELWKITHAGR